MSYYNQQQPPYPPPPQQGWGAPPQQYGQGGYGGHAPPPGPPPGQGGYPAPQGGFPPPPGAPPSGYGAPGGYGSPAAPGGYGASQQSPYGGPPPPAHSPYGATPPAHIPYGAPPPPQQTYGYSAPQQGPVLYLGVQVPPAPPAPPLQSAPPGFDVHGAVERVRKATKGWGTDEKALISVIAPLDAFQADALRRAFESLVGKPLVQVLEKETSSWFQYALRAVVLGPIAFDVWLLNRASSGAGTQEDLLNEVLLGRTNTEIYALKSAYQATYGRDLPSVIRSELSAKTERMFNMALVGNREEEGYVDPGRVAADVEALYRAGEGRMGTDEIAISAIMLNRSDEHLRAVAQQYQAKHKNKLSKAISKEYSGHMKDGLSYIARGVEDDGHAVQRDAELLEASMAGLGTKDERLIYRTVRAHWNRPRFEAIKNAYQAKYGKTLTARVRGETSGDNRDCMVAIIG